MDRRIVFEEVNMRRLIAILFFAVLAIPGKAQTNTLLLNAPQLFERGMSLLQGGTDTRRDLEAVEYFRHSTELGYAPAQVVLGYFYDVGTILTEEPGQALHWYKKAAEQDDVLGELLVGQVVLSGRAAPIDLNEASVWLKKSATQGDPFAAYLLGRVFLEGQDYSAAALWFRVAAMEGIPQAQRQLALLLKDGRGVQQDRIEAYVWLLIATDVLHESGSSVLTEIEGTLDS
jgi:TPR repeat protein